jgi:DNA-binding NarL/FixJ family response regulator
LKILVVDDHALIREGLRLVLRGLDDAVEVYEAANGARAFDIARQQPDLDLVLLDYHLPDYTGLQALEVFGRQHPSLPVVMLSGSVNPRLMHEVMARGASAFVTKSGMSEELLSVIRIVLAGGVHMPLAAPDSYGGPTEPQLLPLTPRQEEVLHLLLDGYTNKEMGRMLGVSEETVKNHVSSILRTFGVATRTQAVVAAGRHGYVRRGADPALASRPAPD